MLLGLIYYIFMFIAVGLAVYGIYLGFMKQWNELTFVAFLFTVTVYILTIVIPGLAHIPVFNVTDGVAENTIPALLGNNLIYDIFQ